ncbi:MAG: hypothetical protein A2W66_06925 [Deltaproteobacteria bacterium RIFCSPLOWO2_02_56_12]|nr:MAG: hypothetical protein A2W66_06925 [Deltaproteobacteria bacterium RIFCSPLOWO2_02_56_12]
MANKSSRKRQKKETEGEVATRVSEMKEGISQMESFMKEAAALAAAEVQRIGEIRENLEETLACLKAELREKEEMLQQRNAALEDLEKGFMARAQDMEILIQRRDDLLEKRETEFREASNKQKKRAAVLEAQLGEKEELLSQKDSAYRELQEGLGARISDLEGEIRRKGELLESREAEIADLQSRINALAVSSEGDGQRRERNTAVVEEAERGLEDGSYLDEPSEEEPEDFEPGVREESKVRLIGKSMRNVMVKPGNIARIGPVPDARKSRLVSLLAPIKKGS